MRGVAARLGSHAATLLVVAIGLALGGGLRLGGLAAAGGAVWAATTGVGLIGASVAVARDLVRRRVGVDVVALLALVGSLVVAEYLAGAVIALMLATGRALEARASARARQELAALRRRAPATARRIEGDAVVSVAVDAVRPGDLLLVAPGEVVPVDGEVVDPLAVLDESALSGEAAVVERPRGDQVCSGGVNGGGAFRLRATARAEDSTYAGILRLVREAEASRAPLTRLADRFALWFVPLTLAVAAVAALAGHDLVRAVAVLVVATPCPLILAAPVALVGGMSRAARRGVVIKSGVALETLGRVQIALFDKTGTLTQGHPRLATIEIAPDMACTKALKLAASLDQASTHALARPIVEAARDEGLTLALPEAVVEEPGRGIRGTVHGRAVRVGRAEFAAAGGPVPGWAETLRRQAAREGMSVAFVSLEGRLAAGLVLEDPLRPDARRMVERLRGAGVQRVVMVTGDHPMAAETIATAAGIDAVFAECSPAGKVDIVRSERRAGTVVMVGDGINDAPALAVADVGVALGVRGATASSESADVVLMVDRIDRLGEAIEIARRSREIALQSIVVGMALSLVAMGFAAAGALAPVLGAVVQELIDVGVIVNALRAVTGRRHPQPPEVAVAVTRGVLREHATMREPTARLRVVADELGSVPTSRARTDLGAARSFLRDELLPHQEREEKHLFPVITALPGGRDATAAARREHAEVRRLVASLEGMLDHMEAGGPSAAELVGLRRVLYGLHAVLGMHRSGEEERLAGIVEDTEVSSAAPGR
jgi:heavy metal translocating P-type ATPase